VKSFKDVVNARGKQKLITVEPTQSVSEAVDLMKKYDIEHIPVVNPEGTIMGSISENGLFQKVFSNPEIKTEKIERVMEKEFPVVAYDTAVEKLGILINKENGAVLAKDESGNYHIITKYDVLQALA
ncbi:MAG TPA: CBS domain-containing protein, partial [Flavisolibacter sp.]